MNTKPWYESKGVWGSLITMAATTAAIAGYAISPADQQNLVIVLTALGTGVGGIVSLIGRLTARSRVTLKGNEFGYANVGILVVLSVLSVSLYGCPGTPFEVRKADIPVSQELSPAAQAAQKAINEANVTLTAAKMLIGDKVANDIITPDEAQAYLDTTREYDAKVDAMQDAMKLGDYSSAETQALLITKGMIALQKEVSNRARE